MGCLCVFLFSSPFSTYSEHATNLAGNLIMNSHQSWWIQPFIFGLLSIQSEVYLWEIYLETMMTVKLEYRRARKTFQRQLHLGVLAVALVLLPVAVGLLPVPM